MAKIGVLTVPRGNELMWTAGGIAMGFIVPALEKRIGGDQFRALAPEVHEAVGALTNALFATGVGVASGTDHAIEYAKGSIGVAAVKTTVMLVRRAQAGGAWPTSRRSLGNGRAMRSLMNEKPRMMLGAGRPRDSVSMTGSGGPARLLFTVNDSNSEILNP